MTIVDKNIDQVKELCNKHMVSKLFVFGSILADHFGKTSDIDFLVDFEGVEIYDYADNYFDFKKSLENLFQRKVDLLENKAINNPFLRENIDSSKRLIYG
ncbi:nucleotidyltransferase domain-containing protein [Aquiflexum sp. LQ15W]|uniref:nucleotidyltransferase family protein n=1 Tax=Cognataquiflexum nitidum TaxID=2922272 RepID=UPI001F13B039|nr:nucleotidyltransferase domain-containing protein [Cognataquiflexum nitidum]MCH6201089.1 nucleotidyltransferase domain-containing protein [Cognataquiflexum nitidum]